MHKLNITNEDINIDIEDTDKYIKYIEKLTNIQWRIIPDFEDYIISEYGNTISLKSKKILKPYLDKDNYYQIALYKNSIHKTSRINRLVYKTFIDQDIEDFDVHHKNENRSNNHYSNLEKINHSKHAKYHRNPESKEYLKKCKKIYYLKYKDHLSTREIVKKLKISLSVVERMIKQYKIYLYLNKDINKYISLSRQDKDKLYSNTILVNDQRRYLEKAEEIYYLKQKKYLSIKEIAKRYNIPDYIIEKMIKRYKIYLYLDKDFNKYISLSKKDKDKLYSNTILVNNQRRYLEKCKEIYYLKYKDHLSIKEIAKKYHILKNVIERMIKRYKIYLYLDKDFNKYISLSKKDKNKLYTKMLVEKRDNITLDLGKKIKDLKLFGLSNKDIANKLNISIGKMTYYYKRYKDLIKKRSM